MTKQSKKIGTITLIGKPNEATEGDANKPSRTGKVIVQTTIGITHLPELGGKAWAWLETHDFEAIKKHREYLYHTFILEEFLNERRIKVLLTTSKDLEDLRRSWLNDELREIDRLMEIPQMSRSDRHELSKYRDYVQSELTPKVEVGTTMATGQGKPTLKQIALRAYYNNEVIASGKGKVYQHFIHYSTQSNRIGVEPTERMTLNKIKLIESVIPDLIPSGQRKANDELRILKANLDREYFEK